MPWVLLPFLSCATEVRQEPKAIRSGLPGTSVAITGSGSVESSGGQTGRSSMATVYAARDPGSRPSSSTRA